MNFLLNVLWLVLGGFSSALSFFTAGLIMLVTIIGIPWARAIFNIGLLTIWPFGSTTLSREELSGEDIGTGIAGAFGNIIWFILAGWWLFLYHFILAVIFTLSIIGIPFAVQYWKLAKISISPIGKALVWK